MSIRSEQTKDILEQLARQLYAQGHKPTLTEIESLIAEHFSENPAGDPLSLPTSNAFNDRRSDPEEFNSLVQRTKVNLDILYRVLLEQLNDTLEVFASAHSSLERLERRRDSLERMVDDALIVSTNSGGYYHSVSDGFRTLEHVDLNRTSAQVDIDNGVVQIPSVPATTKLLPPDAYELASLDLIAGNGRVEQKSSLDGAVHAKERNTYWSVEVSTSAPQEIALQAKIRLSSPDLKEISRIDLTPYGASPVQLAPNGRLIDSGSLVFLGNSTTVISGPHTARFNPVAINALELTMRKTDYDMTRLENGSIRYVYQFGLKSLSLQTAHYDRSASVISLPWSLPDDGDDVLDSVVLEVNEDIPSGTGIDYYVGSSVAQDADFDAIEWKRIKPLNVDRIDVDDIPEKISFKGTAQADLIARRDPDVTGELKLLRSDYPDQSIIPGGADLYRFFRAPDTALSRSVELIEGLNTTKIRYMDADYSVGFQNLGISDFLNKSNVSSTYGRVDDGIGFFYGGDVGRSDVAVLVETFVECDSNIPTFLDTLVCTDSRSTQWDVRVMLNGSVVGEALSGTEKVQIPWSFRKGKNHIALVLRIPDNTYLGQISLMRERDFYREIGLVFQERWKQVSMLDLADPNVDESAPQFAVMEDNTIVSPRLPTDNFRLSYRYRQGDVDDQLLFRADFSRSRGQQVTPLLRLYRLRYVFSDNEDG